MVTDCETDDDQKITLNRNFKCQQVKCQRTGYENTTQNNISKTGKIRAKRQEKKKKNNSE